MSAREHVEMNTTHCVECAGVTERNEQQQQQQRQQK